VEPHLSSVLFVLTRDVEAVKFLWKHFEAGSGSELGSI